MQARFRLDTGARACATTDVNPSMSLQRDSKTILIVERMIKLGHTFRRVKYRLLRHHHPTTGIRFCVEGSTQARLGATTDRSAQLRKRSLGRECRAAEGGYGAPYGRRTLGCVIHQVSHEESRALDAASPLVARSEFSVQTPCFSQHLP